jgi:hypothetical protein
MPASKYQSIALKSVASNPAAFHIRFSLACVPESSPLETQIAEFFSPTYFIFVKASVGDKPFTLAESVLGPAITKKL